MPTDELLRQRILELEENPPRCRRHHRMRIRETGRGFFWGCAAYPFCRHAALLTPEQWKYLHGDDTCAPARGLANAVQLSLV